MLLKLLVVTLAVISIIHQTDFIFPVQFLFKAFKSLLTASYFITQQMKVLIEILAVRAFFF